MDLRLRSPLDSDASEGSPRVAKNDPRFNVFRRSNVLERSPDKSEITPGLDNGAPAYFREQRGFHTMDPHRLHGEELLRKRNQLTSILNSR